MSTPRDGHEPTPFPQRRDEENTSGQRQPPRFPSLGPGARDLTPGTGSGLPPFMGGHPALAPAPAPADSGATIVPKPPTGSGWGESNETYFLPPQFSYNPDQEPVASPPEPPKKSRRRLVLGASGAVAVIAAAAVAVGVVMSGGGSDKPAATAGPTPGQLVSDSHTATKQASATPAWSAPAPQDPNLQASVGSWLVNDHQVVRLAATGLQSFDIGGGQAQWTFTLPDQGTTICGMSQLAIHKIGVIQFGPKDACDNIAAIDTDGGRVLWHGPIPGTGSPTTASGGDVVIGSAGDVVTVWNAADGRKLWDVDLSRANPPCHLMQAGVKGNQAAVLADCGKGPTVLTKDAHTGADLWQAALPTNGLADARITLVNAALPTIVHAESPPGAPTTIDRYFSYDDKGTPRLAFDGVGPFGKLDLREGPEGHQREVAHVTGNTLVAPTAAQDSRTGTGTGTASPASLVAIDLLSGGVKWQAPAAAGGPLTIAALDQNHVVAFSTGDKSTGAKLLAFAMNGGAAMASGADAPLGPDWSGRAGAYVVSGRLVLVPYAAEKGLAVVAFGLR